MRNIIFIFTFALIINGCRVNGNPVASTADPSLSVSTIQGSLQFTFEINKANFEVDDTENTYEPSERFLSRISLELQLIIFHDTEDGISGGMNDG